MQTFEEIDLIAPIRRALADEGYETPTPIQALTVPAALDGRDVLGCAQTGTGKTAAFALPILNRLGKTNRKATPHRPLALALAPTRELAIQIGESFATYGRHLHLRQALVYGGVSQFGQVRSLNRGAHILVATPGRLLDLMNQKYIDLSQLEVFVLDEADRMLDMGFLPDLTRIIRSLPNERQSLFFSATMPPAIIKLSQELLRDPVNVNVTPKSSSVDTIEQRVLYVERNDKQNLLQKILKTGGVDRTLVFTNTKRRANTLAEKLSKCGVNAAAIHGDKSQNARQRALTAFRQNRVSVLVATDVAARGIDVDGISHVVNFDLPVEAECYVHRIGRTGRAGAKGVALSFCSAGEQADLFAIEKFIGAKVPADPDHPQPKSFGSNSRGKKSSLPHSGGRRNGAPKRPASKRFTTKKAAAAGSDYNRSSFKSSASKSSASKSSASKSSASKSTPAKNIAAKNTAANATPAKSIAVKSIVAKKTAAKNAPAKRPASKSTGGQGVGSGTSVEPLSEKGRDQRKRWKRKRWQRAERVKQSG